MLPWREHPAARAELLDAVDRYVGQDRTLGAQFYRALVSGLETIRTWPDSGRPRVVSNGALRVRSKRLEGFPYSIVYVLSDETIVVIAYAHERRKPGYWKPRTSELYR